MALFHGGVDPLANPTDVAWLVNDSDLDKSLIKKVKMLNFAHVSFELGTDMSYITDDVIPLIKEVHE